MINKKLLIIALGAFFTVSVCGVIFHFNSKNGTDLGVTVDDISVSSNNLVETEVSGEPLDRTGDNAVEKIDSDSDVTTDEPANASVEISNNTDIGDALWEEAKKQEDSVVESSSTEVSTDAAAEDEVEKVTEDATVETSSTDADSSTEADTDEVIGKFTVTNTGLVVRTGPRGTYDSLDTLPIDSTGEIVEVINDYWVKIKYKDTTAYICSKYADIELY